MALNFSDYFTSQAIAAYWQNAYSNQLPYLGDAFFRKDRKAGLDLKWIKGSKGIGVSLMPSTFDARAKFRDHVGFSEQETEMPFFREGYLIKEKDRQELLRIQDSGDPYAQEIISRIYDDAADLIEGARIVPERMIWSLLAPTNGNAGISIKANGVDYTYNYDKDGSWKVSNYTEITKSADKWSTAASSDPLGDLMKVQQTAQNRNGTQLTTAVMSSNTFNYLLKAASVKGAVLSQNTTANVLMTNQVVKNLFSVLTGLNLVIYSKVYRDESKTEHAFYPDDYVTLLPDGNLGTVYRGITPEEADLRYKRDVDVTVVDNGIAVTKLITPHPVNTEIYVSEIVLPSFERMDDVYVLKVA